MIKQDCSNPTDSTFKCKDLQKIKKKQKLNVKNTASRKNNTNNNNKKTNILSFYIGLLDAPWSFGLIE